jgi:preprotein translocase subunit SecG
MGFVIGLLTVVMVFDCLLLILLILIQLPKKEAGAALAFGGGTTDALFGAGSGTVLTKITKYAATGFFLLAVIVSVMVNRIRTQGTSSFEKGFANPARPSTPAPAQPAPTVTPNASPSAQVVSPVIQASNLTLPAVESTNTPALAPSPATSNAAPVPAPK